MKIVSLLEDKNIEKRIAITPETAKKYISSGFEVILSKTYGEHLGIADKEYEDLGVKFSNDVELICNQPTVYLKIRYIYRNKITIVTICIIA